MRAGQTANVMNQTFAHTHSAPSNTPLEARILALFAIIAATTVVAALGGLISSGEADEWYLALSKAPGTPPGIVFAVVWPVLYSLMTISAAVVWNAAGDWRRADGAIGVYFVQLAANLGWTSLFFFLHRPLAALVDLAILWILVAVMMREFARHNHIAAQLQAPYLLWLSFAFYLNAWVVFAN